MMDFPLEVFPYPGLNDGFDVIEREASSRHDDRVIIVLLREPRYEGAKNGPRLHSRFVAEALRMCLSSGLNFVQDEVEGAAVVTQDILGGNTVQLAEQYLINVTQASVDECGKHVLAEHWEALKQHPIRLDILR